RQEGPRIQILVAQFEKGAAMHQVLSGLHYEVEQPTRRPPILGTHAGGLHLELLYSFGRRTLLICVARAVTGRRRAVHENLLRKLRRPQNLRTRGAAGDSRRELDREVLHIAASAAEIERQLIYHTVLKDDSDDWAIGLERRSVGRHGHGLLGLSDG